MESKKRSAPRVDGEEAAKLMTGQTAAVRENLRKRQRDVLEVITSNRHAIGDVKSTAFRDIRAANNQLEREVRYVRESVLDVVNLKEISKAASKQATALTVVTQAVTADKLIRELRSKFRGRDDAEGSDGDFDWAKLGRMVSSMFAAVPPVDFLLGPIGKAVAGKKERQRRVRDEDGDAETVRPEDVTEKNEELVEATQQRLASLSARLATLSQAAGVDGKIGKVEFFSTLVNPKSFTQTVENIFDFSFLLKQGHVGLSVEDGAPKIEPFSAREAKDDDADQKSTQLVVSFTPADMRRAAKLFGCTGAGVPHRTDATYDPNYLGTLVGAAASSSSSSSSSPAVSSKG
jgi:hypothetical protein